MAVATGPNLAPILAWDKGRTPTKTPRKKVNPLGVILGLAMLILAGTGIWRALHSGPSTQFVKVLVPNNDVAPGARLGFLSLRYMDIPRNLATKDMTASLKALDGRVARSFLPSGEPIRDSALFPPHQGLAASLENDERAITLQLNDDELIDHSIQPDDTVDVLAVMTGKDGKKYTKTICQTVRVLMASSKEVLVARKMSGFANKITLGVTPHSGEEITEALAAGKLRLVLRNRLSRTDQSLPGCDEEELLPASAAAKTTTPEEVPAKTSTLAQTQKSVLPPPPSPPVQETESDKTLAGWFVEMLSGNKRELVNVPPR